jgi:hypothetical protein
MKPAFPAIPNERKEPAPSPNTIDAPPTIAGDESPGVPKGTRQRLVPSGLSDRSDDPAAFSSLRAESRSEPSPMTTGSEYAMTERVSATRARRGPRRLERRRC